MSQRLLLRGVVWMPSPATTAPAVDSVEAGPARWEQMHRALNRALIGATLEHRRATLRVHEAHHDAAAKGAAGARLDVEIAVDHLNEVQQMRNDLLAVIRQVRSLAIAARQQASADANRVRHG